MLLGFVANPTRAMSESMRLASLSACGDST
jgi:hypothetical protein